MLRQLQLQHPLGEERLRGLKHGHEVRSGLRVVVHVERHGAPDDHEHPLPPHDIHATLRVDPADPPILPVGEGEAGARLAGEHVGSELRGGSHVGDAVGQRTVEDAATDARHVARVAHCASGGGEAGVVRVPIEEGGGGGLVGGLGGGLGGLGSVLLIEKLGEGAGCGLGGVLLSEKRGEGHGVG